MAPKKPPSAAGKKPPLGAPGSPPAAGVEGDPLDAYSEGEEEEIPKSKIKVQIIAAIGVWGIESGDEKSKIGFDIMFPDEPPPPTPNPAAPPVEMETFLPDVEPNLPKRVWPCPPPPPPPPPPAPANFTSSFQREYERTPSYRLCNTLVQQEMVINVHWISPTGAAKAPIAMTKVNLAGLLHLNKTPLTNVSLLTPYVEPPPPPVKTPAGKSPAKPPPPKKGAPPPPPAPVEKKPQLLEGATLKIVMTTSEPLVNEADRKHGFVMEVDVVTIRSLPPKVAQYGPLTEGSVQPFAYTVGFTLPGFTPDSPWWSAMSDLDPATKATFDQFKVTTGTVTEEKVEVPNPVVPINTFIGPRELKRLLFGGEEVNPCSVAKLHADPPFIKEMHKVVVWKASGAKRYLPGQAANEVRENIKRKKYIQGAVARYLTEESFKSCSDPFFERYRATFDLDMMPFFDEEGATCLALACPLREFDDATGTVFCPRDPRPGGKGPPVEDDSGPPPGPVKGAPPTPKNEPPKPVPNAWKQAGSAIYVTIKTSAPMEPVWKPPPDPELKVENLIPRRPKCPNLHDSVKAAIEKFKDFVQIAAHDISSLHQKALQGEDDVPLGADATPDTKSRIQSKVDVRRKVVTELHESGAWQQMRDEMKSRVLRIAEEKFRLGQKEALTAGKFEFCNTLYVKLMEEIHKSIADMFLKRQRAASALEGNRKESSEKEKKLILLRQLADESEYDLDYRTANRYHQDRLIGETIYNPDIWFEYGYYSMRSQEGGRPVDRGKAEECFREALTLDSKHILSLLALACLMWHRNYHTQAEVLLRTAIDMHSEEEWLCWCVLSQVYYAQGQEDNEKSSLKKAQILYNADRENRNCYSPPHVLLNPLLKFPFSVGHLFLQENRPSCTIYVETALLLLDLHLQKEAKQILDLKGDVFSTNFANKWAQAKVHELNKEYAKAEIWIKENLSLCREDAMSWLCLGRMRYVNKKYAESLEAYEKHIRYRGNKPVYCYVHLDIGNIHLKLKNYSAAKEAFLKLCKLNPTRSSWLGAGIASFRMCEHKHCEIALVEANHIDSKSPKVWTYLTLVCLTLGRNEEAEISFQQLQKVEFHDVPLLLELADRFAKCGNYRDAEAAAGEAVKEEGEGEGAARLKLGKLYHQQGKLESAKQQYEAIAKMEGATCDEKSLAEDCLQQVQAEMASSASLPAADRRVTI